MGPDGRIPASFILLLFLFHAVMSGPAVLNNTPFDPFADNQTSIVVFDVCGHAASSGAIQCPDFTVVFRVAGAFISPDKDGYTPAPDDAVASAESGRIEKPPKPA